MRNMFAAMRRITHLFSFFVSTFLTIGFAQNVHSETAYFLVRRKQAGNDVFVLPLSKAEEIAEARRQLIDIPLGQRPGLTFRAVAGSDSVNRNYLATDAPFWSWHVTELVNFIGSGSGLFPGSPTNLEHGVEGWLRQTKGLMSFYYYVIADEITAPFGIAISVQQIDGILTLAWSDMGLSFIYTVEESDSFSPGVWKPVPGESWPRAGTKWQTTALTSTRLFRVKAQMIRE
jgi:hypothetical protein